MKKVWGFIVKFIFLPILGLSGFFGMAIAWYILSVWSFAYSVALVTQNKLLIKIIAIDFPIETIRQEGKMLRHIITGFVISLVLFAIGFLEQ